MRLPECTPSDVLKDGVYWDGDMENPFRGGPREPLPRLAKPEFRKIYDRLRKLKLPKLELKAAVAMSVRAALAKKQAA